MLAVDAVVEHLKKMSRQVTTPEEIAQVFNPLITIQLVLPITVPFLTKGAQLFFLSTHILTKKER